MTCYTDNHPSVIMTPNFVALVTPQLNSVVFGEIV